MASEYTTEQLLEKYQRAPKIAQDILGDENFGPLVFSIATAEGATPDQALDVEDATVHALIGIFPFDRFEDRLREKAGLSENIARAIRQKIDKEIFDLVRKVSAEDGSREKPKTGGANPETPREGTAENTARAPAAPEKPKHRTFADVFSPKPKSATPRHIFEEKLRAMRESGKGHEPAPAPAPTPTRQDENRPEGFPPRTAGYKGVDPYREPVE